MRIPETLAQCVCFLCVKITKGDFAGQYKPIGTAFFVSTQVEDFEFLYLVTAKHNLETIDKHWDTFYLRINDKKKGIEYVEIKKNKAAWLGFGMEDIDLAVLSVGGIDTARFGNLAISVDAFATNKVLVDQWIGLGDEIFAIGLFTGRTGTQKNIPILRTGIIASMPEEPIKDGDKEYDAFLVELRSIGGISGSPVFVYLNRERAATTKLPHNQISVFYLLGVIRGKWTLDKKLIKEEEELDVLGYNKGESLNLGIAIVTPADQLWQLIMHEKLMEVRQDYVNSQRTVERITEDSDVGDLEGLPEQTFTDADFQTSLKQASRKISEPVSEKKETSE